LSQPLPRGLASRLPSLLALLLAAALVALVPTQARAGSMEVGETVVRTAEPTSIDYSLRVRTSAGLESATFRYKVLNPDGNVGGSGSAEFSPGTETDVRFTLETRTAQRYIPVGSEIAFQWELRDKDGDTRTTDEERHFFMDGRYQWQSRNANGVTVFWYGDNDQAANLALQATKSAVEETEALLDTEIPYPVKVVVWRNEGEGNLAMRPRGETFDELVITGGQRVAPDLLFVFAPNADVIRHEAAHIVTHVAGDGPFSSIPSWLDEGTAVYMQSSPGSGYTLGVQFAIQGDGVQTLRSMQSPSNNPEQVNAFYGQSWSTVKFMIDQWGEEKFAELFKQVREGARIDSALQAVYEVDQDGLYNLWREANGLPPKEFSPRASGTSGPAAESTRAPLRIPTPLARSGQQTPGGQAGAGGDGPSDAGAEQAGAPSNAVVAIVIGGGAVLLAGLLGGAGLYLTRRRG
jgi:hypothetical protein